MDTEAEREILRGLQQRFEKAVKENKIEDIKDITHDDFSFVSFTDRCFMDFDSFSKRWKLTRDEMVGDGHFETSLSPKPTFFYGDIAVAHGNSTNQMKDNKGKDFNFTSNWTVIFKKMGDGWKVVRAHNSLDPFANLMMVSAVKNKLFMISGMVGLAGLMLGLLIGKIS